MHEPLWMPRGSVRALIALLVTGSLPGLVLLLAVGYTLPDSAMGFVTAAVMLVMRDYFGSRNAEEPVEEPSEVA